MNVRCTLKKNSDFRRLYSKGKSTVNPYMAVYCRRNGRGVNRVGYTVSTKLGHAVVRNRVRRRLREIYRLNREKMPAGYDIIIVARVRAAETPYRKLERHYLRCLGELGLLTDA